MDTISHKNTVFYVQFNTNSEIQNIKLLSCIRSLFKKKNS